MDDTSLKYFVMLMSYLLPACSSFFSMSCFKSWILAGNFRPVHLYPQVYSSASTCASKQRGSFSLSNFAFRVTVRLRSKEISGASSYLSNSVTFPCKDIPMFKFEREQLLLPLTQIWRIQSSSGIHLSSMVLSQTDRNDMTAFCREPIFARKRAK
jgi:hypothetical protein